MVEKANLRDFAEFEEAAREVDVISEADVIVVGGGAAGLAAALGAKKAGSRVLMIERNGCLGGQATNASVLSYWVSSTADRMYSRWYTGSVKRSFRN